MDISQITEYLYVGAQPRAEHAEELRARDVRLIISMIGTARPAAAFAEPPFRLLWLRTYDTFLTPIPISKLMEGVQAALPVIRSGGRVLTYCAQGRHPDRHGPLRRGGHAPPADQAPHRAPADVVHQAANQEVRKALAAGHPTASRSG